MSWFNRLSRPLQTLWGAAVLLCACLGGYTFTDIALRASDSLLASNAPLNVTATPRAALAQTPRPTPTSTPTETATPSPTATPTTTPPPLATATRAATATPTLTAIILPTPTPNAQAAQPRCRLNVAAQSEFYALWLKYARALGCPQIELPIKADESRLNEQWFENGHMFFFSSPPVHLVLVKYGAAKPGEVGQGAWQVYQSRAWPGLDENYCDAGNGLEPPIYDNFNIVWCSQATLRKQLGNPKDLDSLKRGRVYGAENARLMLAQSFELGFIFRDSDGAARRLAYIFLSNGTYIREAY